MKQIKRILSVLTIAALFTSCATTPEDVAGYVQEGMENKMDENDIDNVEITNITLKEIGEGDGKYEGTIETYSEGIISKAPVKVKFKDGQVKWNVDQDAAENTFNLDEIEDDVIADVVREHISSEISETTTDFIFNLEIERIDRTNYKGTASFHKGVNDDKGELKNITATFDGENVTWEVEMSETDIVVEKLTAAAVAEYNDDSNTYSVRRIDLVKETEGVFYGIMYYTYNDFDTDDRVKVTYKNGVVDWETLR